MIEKANGGFTIICDRCPDSEDFPMADSFAEFVAEYKDMGWRAFKDPDDEWTHVCPACASGSVT